MRKNKILPVIALCLVAGLAPACSSKKPGGKTTPTPSVEPTHSVDPVSEFTITFTYCDGEAPVRIKGKDGESIDLPAGKSLDGKTFAGWSTEFDSALGYGKLTALVKGKTFKINGKNQTLYAAYYEKGTTPTVQPTEEPTEEPTQQTYSITFDYCDSSVQPVVKTGVNGDLIRFPEGKSFGIKIFAGWSTELDTEKGFGNINKILNKNSTRINGKNEIYYAAYNLQDSHTDKEVEEYMNGLKQTSEMDHLYYHYYRFDDNYSDWDVWAWPYRPTEGEGAKHDFLVAKKDSFGGAYVDIDLNHTYKGGWDAGKKQFLNLDVSYADSEQIGLQIVKSSTRQSGGGFWVNDGSNLYVTLSDYAMDLPGGGKAYHIFVVQDNVQEPKAIPSSDNVDPFENDDGNNVTYGNSKYDNVNWSTTPAQTSTAADFKDVGVGYQIMVSSFADSDGDGFGDIYGITQKLNYLEKLGVKALWLTPIQLSDSYHGYDITDYETVDPKFGSKMSTAAIQNGGVVTSETALADYKELIKQAHAKGMKIVMDLVLNHTSTSNKWFVKSANLDPDYRGYYQWGNHNTQSKIKEENCWYQYGDHPYSYYAKFGSAMPELNFSYVDTRTAVENMSVYWVKDIGVDGFRLDAVKHIYMSDESTARSSDTIILDKAEAGDYSSNLTKNLHFFRELKSAVTKGAGRDVFFVGENFDGHAYHVAPYYEAFDSLFDFYSYFNLTSAAATGRTGNTSAYGTAQGFMQNNSTYTTSADTNLDKSHGTGAMSKANNGAWNFPAVYKVYNSYRGGTSLPGAFTSNHDIARVINRVAGTGDFTGLSKQGNITTSNYDSMEQSANCVKIAELMFPGLTWVYYGDEIGMTGNFPAGKDANSDYADLWYRQPMKWGSSITDDMTCGYSVTGSSATVGWDTVNASNKVVGANTQMNSSTSQFSILSNFIKVKSAGDAAAKALTVGSIKAENYVSGNLAANVLCFSRTYNGTTVKVAVNFNNQAISAYNLSGTVLAKYNNASASSLPAYSAIVVKA